MSKIEWTNKTQNPIKVATGGNYCEMVSPGCANCYAIPLFVKQLGSRWAGSGHDKGGNPDEWPQGFRVRQFPGRVEV